MDIRHDRQTVGAWGEETAARYLQSHGWTILDRNWRCPFGELDIVAFDPLRDAIVAVEVKTRRSVSHGFPEEAVTARKMDRMRSAFVAWLKKNRRRAAHLALDVIAITAHSASDFRLNHVKDAA
ncbi:YraN family protein [Arcanobacterium haemolyticum]|uniref:UPF0102 protein Arch_0576 n=1 Tax=Arcanobacterium haemolyticum (strain ATCC 9345 / DSM 20595 / CCM 5947 / CCUG 17215 / LMG 16163 / NBRC 15585 / NCTC 8452 / 11018) TaxID=644284 RepID=D7BN16_ARCHD|nr:YraN family protein [Arcanobacterium haemolyticum]ADH92315.1 protein of unknown function UPF0102 [Arcanobacterium haemolyticum DSM 20595]QCX46447.1 YraN family protein [Arcanobacterium haemolyticum]SQH28964.1 Uncharacterised protein family UPF0102 [Arcanobacterium haemolyticum]